VGVCLFPLFTWWLGAPHVASLAFGIATAVLVVVRHKDNLRRLVRGEELKA
jgi:glycerol-3-phosphate acyltransferase PlsY